MALTANYGEAATIDVVRGRLPLPPAYSGHNAYWDWGPPPEGATITIVVGWRSPSWLDPFFGRCQEVSRIDNSYRIDNDEQGAPILVCHDRQATWARLWPRLRHLD